MKIVRLYIIDIGECNLNAFPNNDLNLELVN